MTPRAVSTLFELLHRGVALTVVDGRLRVWPASALDDGLRAAVARDKPESAEPTVAIPVGFPRN